MNTTNMANAYHMTWDRAIVFDAFFAFADSLTLITTNLNKFARVIAHCYFNLKKKTNKETDISVLDFEKE